MAQNIMRNYITRNYDITKNYKATNDGHEISLAQGHFQGSVGSVIPAPQAMTQ